MRSVGPQGGVGARYNTKSFPSDFKALAEGLEPESRLGVSELFHRGIYCLLLKPTDSTSIYPLWILTGNDQLFRLFSHTLSNIRNKLPSSSSMILLSSRGKKMAFTCVCFCPWERL